MSRVAAVLLAAALSAAATSARAADALLECPMGTQKFSANQVVCMPRDPRNWIVCTGAPVRGNAGAWRDTTISCSSPPPTSPAEWGPVAEVPHPPPPAADAKRVIDLFAGVEFTCVPASTIAWTREACGKIAEEWTRQAAAAKIVGVVYDFAGDPVAERKTVETAGLPLGSAVRWKVTFEPNSIGGINLGSLMTGVLEVLPGIYGRRAILIGGDLDMRPDEAKPANALAGAKQIFSANFEFLLGPR